MVTKINTIVAELTNLMLNMDSLNVVELTADHITAGTIDTNEITITAADGTKYYRINDQGIVAFNGTQNTLEFNLATGLLTLVSMMLKSSNSNEKVVIDSTGFHSYDASNVERLTIGTTPAQGAKALIGRDTAGAAQSVYTYDTSATVDGSFTGQFITAHGAIVLISNDGDIRIINSAGQGFRAISGTPEVNDGLTGWKKIATQGVSGTFYVAAASGGAVTTRLTFTNGVLTAVL